MLRVAVGESQPTGTAVGSKQRRGRVKAAVGNDGKTGEAHGSPSVQQGLQKSGHCKSNNMAVLMTIIGMPTTLPPR